MLLRSDLISMRKKVKVVYSLFSLDFEFCDFFQNYNSDPHFSLQNYIETYFCGLIFFETSILMLFSHILRDLNLSLF